MLDQFANPDNPLAHYETTGPEIWRDTDGQASRTSSRAWAPPAPSWAARATSRRRTPAIQIIGCQPQEGSQIPGIRKWPEAYLPKIYERTRVDRVEST